MNPDLLTSQFETLEEPEEVPSVDIIEPPDVIVPKIRQMLKLMPME